MANNSPSPWRIQKDNGDFYLLDAKDESIGFIRREFDARIICAAPDLLEALEALMADMHIDPEESAEGCSKLAKKAIAAWRKAKGRTTP